MKRAVFWAAALFAAVRVFASGEMIVVPTSAPALVLKGRTLADVQANEISGTAIGTHTRPRNMVGYNKVMLPAADGQPKRLRVEMQMMDSYHLKCIVLELFDGEGGVHGRAVAARYVLTKDQSLGWKFVNDDGSLNGSEHPLGTDPKGSGYGLANLTLVPRDIDVGGGGAMVTSRDDSQRSRGTRDPTSDTRQIEAARGVIARFAGEDVARQLALEIIPFDAGRPVFEVLEKGRRIRASNGATLAKAFYTDVTRKGAGVCSWSGNRFDADVWKNGTPNDDLRVVSPFRRHLYMQPCTASYTTAFWDEARWMREIDWMALHGYDLPNAVTAFEAILERVWKKHGLTDAEIEQSFAGPAYLAFSRMSCVDNAISSLPAAWRKRSVPLQHAICRRLRSLGMDVMAQGFAGAVPAGLKRVHPNAKMAQLTWAGRYHSWFLYPDDPLFVQIGAEIVREWEREFGKGEYYLCDSFIEMSRSMPWLKDGDEATRKGLETCGRNIYGALKAANPDAVWTLQGWIFINAPNIWTKDRVDAFLSAVPADKMLLVDNCVECLNRRHYRNFLWNWDKYQSYNGRRWAWSPIPNYGGNTLVNGDLPFNANGHLSAIASGNRGALYAFGTMTEAIEVLDDVFEVLSAAGWRDRPVEIVDWLERYSLGRWGVEGAEVRTYWQQMLAGVYGEWNGDFRSERFSWQNRPANVKGNVHGAAEAVAAMKTMRGLAAKVGGNPIFRRDFAVQSAHAAGKIAELLLASGKPELVARGDRLLEGIDAVLAGHPTHDLRTWIAKARSCADGDEKLADYYETDARRIITVWAPGLGDYAARVWSGLVANYYLPRLRMARAGKAKEIYAWQNKWVEERLPIAPPAAGWTCEKLVDELVAAWGAFSGRMDRSKLLIGAYCLQANAKTDVHVKAIHDCGVDFIVGGLPASDRATLDIFAKHGVGAIVNGVVPGWWGGDGKRAGKMRETNPPEKYAAGAAAFKDHPAIWAIDIGDEPSALDFPYYGDVVRQLNKALPGMPLYLNLYPNYASVAQNNGKQTVNQLGTKTYAEHVDVYCREVPLDYISYDFYPYMWSAKDTDRFLSKMYDNFIVVSEACRRTKRSFWYVPQVNSREGLSPTSENRIRFQAYAALSFGAEAITWACWCKGWWANNVLDAAGRQTGQYEKLKRVNTELKQIGPHYMRFRNVATRLVGFASGSPRRPSLPCLGAPDDSGYVKASNGAPLIVGEMVARDPALGERAFFVTAADDPADVHPAKFDIVFNVKAKRVEAFYGNGAIPVSRRADGSCAVPLASCQGVLIVLQN